NLKGYRVEVHFNGWPADPATLDDADTIMTISDGQDGNLFSPVPWMTEQRMAVIRKQMQRGCGFITFHFSTFAPDSGGKDILEWGGGYFDWEDEDGQRNWYSAIKTLQSKVELGSPEHPVSRGLKPLEFREEFYYKIRFRENDPRLKPIWRVPELGEGLDNIVAWSVERNDGGRGFSTTCGHFYDNWEQPQFRKMILNALVWTAGGVVPAEGVESEFYPDEEVSRILAGPPVEALIVTGHQYPGHLWKDTTPAIREALARDIRMNVSIVEDVEFLAKPKLHEYDMIVLNYCNWMKPGLSDAAKANFVKYLKEGGGLTIVHFTNGAFHFSLPEAGDSDWPEWRTNICRRVWDHTPGKSGHDKYGPFVVEIAKPDHPIVAGMEPFQTTDELYFRQQGDHPIEVLATARSEITGQHEPMAFIYEYGKGRVFQTVLGHSADSIRVDGTAELICRGSLWVADRDPHLIPNPNRPVSKVEPLIPGRFGTALAGTTASAEVAHRDEYQTWPLTVECRAKVDTNQGFQLLVAKNLKSSGKHWEIYTYAGTGEFSAYLPGYQPAENKSGKSISDGQWHDLAMTFDGTELELFVDGTSVLKQTLKAVKTEGADGPLWFGSYPPSQLGLRGAIDEVRILKGIRTPSPDSMDAWTVDEQTLGLWSFDELVEGNRFTDLSKLQNHATLAGAAGKPIPKVSALPPGAIREIVEGHWGHDVVGFGWQEEDSVDGRLNQMQTGPFFSGTIATPKQATMKGLCFKLGDQQQASICYDTELLRTSAGWTGGFLEHDSRRYGLIRPASLKGPVLFQTPAVPGWSRDDSFPDPRPDKPWGPLPRELARYEGLYRHGNRVVLKYTVGGTEILESPWAIEREKKNDCDPLTADRPLETTMASAAG
ncbi:MAG TPA: ThuA domain-containing protein, partial [Planctomycetaceae bacterium]|nr:ThuA domain-containing protein [Planctomycetaceae bacterium]